LPCHTSERYSPKGWRETSGCLAAVRRVIIWCFPRNAIPTWPPPPETASGPTMNSPLKPLYESRLHSLPPFTRGKVRDIYRVDDKHLLIVATDRISAFDVVLPDPIPGKGVLLTALSNFWFERLRGVVKNHLTGIDPVSVLADPRDHATVAGRAIVVDYLKPLPIEAVVRGYL